MQKLALLLEVDMQKDRLMELVPPIAIAAQRNLLQLKDTPALLWGFAGATPPASLAAIGASPAACWVYSCLHL